MRVEDRLPLCWFEGSHTSFADVDGMEWDEQKGEVVKPEKPRHYANSNGQVTVVRAVSVMLND